MLSLLPILLMEAAAVSPPPSSADLADARCIFIYGFVGSRGTPAQAEQARQGTIYFVGKLRGRNTSPDLGRLLAFAGDNAKRSSLSPKDEGTRCESELRAAGTALVNGANAAKSSP